MQSFEDLDLPSELTEALSAEGFEEPTEFQRTAIPLLRRGNNVFGAAGPGAGTLLAYGTAILEKTEPQAGRPGALVLVPTAAAATGLAESLGRIASMTGAASYTYVFDYYDKGRSRRVMKQVTGKD